ncbi:UDP-glucose dehydrogenase family protein [Rubrobacter aplysinae]|uniref:UDP-glucose dehydrogenase family protein n=1 Tax=Rubrobacter aplysinae TaxID=909625 RepID=UPI0009FD685D|nr:UDP-glucose/GDP-mannose dehydrogenase family protein [Rubrobacter aplysinae]
MQRFDVVVVGAGYVGLSTGACLAHLGHRVTFVDRDAGRVEGLSAGVIPVHEPHLGDIIRTYRDRISFTTSLAEAVPGCEMLFVAVDTPQGEGGSADLSNVAAVARDLGRILAADPGGRSSPLLVVNKSTVPVGSGDYVSMLVREGMSGVAEAEGNGADFRVVSNPEFLREGSAVHDTLFPDRIVLGSESEAAFETMRELYRPIIERSFEPVPSMSGVGSLGGLYGTSPGPFPEGGVPFVTTDLQSAEMIKYAANAFLATKISFINEISNICELVGADVTSVSEGIGLDGRIGSRFLDAGAGWGGSCFPKDVSALRAAARERGYEPGLLDAAVAVNERQRGLAVAKLQQEIGNLEDRRVALLGLAFKPGTDDLRDAPSLYIARELRSLGARVVGYDPVAGEKAREVLASSGVDLEVAEDPHEALRGAHAAVIVTDWEEVRSLDLARAAREMEEPKMLVDGRNVLDPAEARAQGLRYEGFGRG